MKKSISKIGFALLLCLSLFSSAYIQNVQPTKTAATKLEFEDAQPSPDQLVKFIDFTNKLVTGISEVIQHES